MTSYRELERVREASRDAADTRRAAEAAWLEAVANPLDRPGAAAARRTLDRAELAEAARVREMATALSGTIADLDSGVPLLLLPVRLETRYDVSGSTTRLRIRVYPDDIHLDTHEPELTETEVAAGESYWRQIWGTQGPGEVSERQRAWTGLITGLGPERAAWVARALAPTNPRSDPAPAFPMPARRGGRWTRAAQARLLPDCWQAEAWRGGTRIATASGGLIRRPLAAGPDPRVSDGDTVDPGMRWMTDFSAALDAGMGLVMDLPDRDPIDLLLVFGVRGTQSAADDAAEFAGLLEAHRFGIGAGLDLVAAGTPTNNTEASPAGYGGADPTGVGRFVDPLAPPRDSAAGDGGDAERLSAATSLPAERLRELPGASNRGVSLEADMATLLWPATWGYYLTQMLRPEEFDRDGAAWRRWILDTVRAGGPLPVLRAGRQPYGILPVTSMQRWRPTGNAGLVSVELVRPAGGVPGSPLTQLRVFAGLGRDGGWTFIVPQAFDLPTPPDASAVAVAAAGLGRDARFQLIVAHAVRPDPATGGIVCATVELTDSGPTVLAEFPIGPVAAGFPDRPLRGLALAAGPISEAERRGGRVAPDLAVVLQYEPPNRRERAQTLLLVGTHLTGAGAVGWSEPVDISDQLAARELVASAALLPRADEGIDLIVVTEVERAAAGASRARWRVARKLDASAQVGEWSAPVDAGTHQGGGASAGSAVALADVDQDGTVEAMLAQYSPLADGTVAASYALGRAPIDGIFSWTGAVFNLGGGLFFPAGYELVGAAFAHLPWTPFRETAPGLATASQQVNLLQRLRGHWRMAAGRVNRVRAGDPDPDRTLLDLLATDAVSETFERRPFVGNQVLNSTWMVLGSPPHTGNTAATAVDALLQDLGIRPPHPPRLGRGAYTDLAQAVAPAASGEDIVGILPSGAGRDEVLPWLGDMLKATPAELHDNWLKPEVPLFARLVRHSLLQAYADAAFALVKIPGADPPPLPEPELIDLADVTAADPSTPITLTSWRHLSNPNTLVNGEPVADVLWRTGQSGSSPLPEVQPLLETLAALARLAARPAGELARLVAGVLDLASHRLDAWITAVATHRLAEMRAASASGLQAGGYGFVRELGPASGAPSTGYVHAPSMTHAATAAVLRSGYLSHDRDQLAIDLTSRRVRAALDVLGAVREGQSLGAALGYRFERTLYDLRLAQYLGAIRQLVPLDVGQLRPMPAGIEVSAVAAMVTTDGLALLARFEVAGLPWGTIPPGQQQRLPDVGTTDQAAIVVALDQLRDVADAIADIGTAEGVHQLLQRNQIRAAGTLDALTRGEMPVSDDPDVLRTPRQGTGVTHRLLLVAPDPAAQGAAAALARWPAATAEQRSRRVRAAAEPRLDAWAAMMLGDPARVRFRVSRRDPATDAPPLDPVSGQPVDDPVTFALADVGLCPWDVLAGPSPGVASLAETNLGRRLLRHAEATFGGGGGAALALITERAETWGPEILSVPELLTLAESGRNLVMAARAADGTDLRASGTAGRGGVDGPELAARLQAARAALTGARDQLRAFFTIGTVAHRDALRRLFPGLDAGIVDSIDNLLDLPAYCDIAPAAGELRRPEEPRFGTCGNALELLSGFGIADAAPRTRTANSEGDRAALAVQARAAHTKAVERLAASEKAAADDPRKALEAIFGDGFRVLPLFTHGLAPAPTPSGATRDAVDRWFDGMAMVREGPSRLQEFLVGSEIAGGASAAWDVIQLPAAVESARWVALATDPGPPPSRIPAGCVSIVASTPVAGWRAGTEAAALMIDAWVETIPSAEENTAIAFHLNTPDACAPQAMLLAVAPDPVLPWSWPALSDLLRETIELAEIRAVDIDLLPSYGHLLPALMIAHNTGGVPGGDTIATSYGA